MEQLLRVPVDRTEVGLRRDQPDLVADVLRHQRRLRVVEDDAVLLVDETLAEEDLGQDRFHAERPDVIDERLVLCVEDLPLPGEMIDHAGDCRRPRRRRLDDGRALRLAIRNGARRTVGKQLVDVGLGHLQKLGYVVCHCILLAWTNRRMSDGCGGFPTRRRGRARAGPGRGGARPLRRVVGTILVMRKARSPGPRDRILPFTPSTSLDRKAQRRPPSIGFCPYCTVVVVYSGRSAPP